MEQVLAGAAAVDITPPAGLAMAGFGARTEPAEGAHDALSVRAVVVGSTAIVGVDVLSLGRATTARIRAGAGLGADAIVVAALHTHGGPETFLDHPFARPDPGFMARLEAAAIEAVNRAAVARQPARIAIGAGADPGIARNRRRPDGPTDPTLPVIAIRTPQGRPIATLVSYACHPVVLGANNRRWTADYPGVVRSEIERRQPGTLALFLTGCTGDANIGHSAHASFNPGANAARTFENAERIGRRIADCALAAPLADSDGGAAIASREVTIAFRRREAAPAAELAATWRREQAGADPVRQAMLAGWIRWAEAGLPDQASGLTRTVRVSALRWGGAEIIALPAENFAATAHRIRRAIGNPAAMVIAYADDTFGYIPTSEEFPAGGYEVEEAHRYYGMPATVAPGTAEALADAAADLILGLRAGHPAA
jgi:hypothetical protein